MSKEPPTSRNEFLKRFRAKAPGLYYHGYAVVQTELSRWLARKLKNREGIQLKGLVSLKTKPTNKAETLHQLELKDNRKK